MTEMDVQGEPCRFVTCLPACVEVLPREYPQIQRKNLSQLLTCVTYKNTITPNLVGVRCLLFLGRQSLCVWGAPHIHYKVLCIHACSLEFRPCGWAQTKSYNGKVKSKLAAQQNSSVMWQSEIIGIESIRSLMVCLSPWIMKNYSSIKLAWMRRHPNWENDINWPFYWVCCSVRWLPALVG
jgi:hypothetical protein